MKKSLFFHVLIFALLTVISSCKEQTPTVDCLTETVECGTYTACCTPFYCYYEFDGKRYDCDGLNCKEAAEELARALELCNPSAKAGQPLITAEEILASMPCYAN